MNINWFQQAGPIAVSLVVLGLYVAAKVAGYSWTEADANNCMLVLGYWIGASHKQSQP